MVMTSHFLQLPPELREYVYSYCTTCDLLSLGCCSKALYASLKYILWKVVKVPWHALRQRSLPRIMENLLNTHHLSFYENCNDSRYDNKKKHRNAWIEISMNYEKVLNLCNPKNLTKLDIIGVATNPQIKQTVIMLKNLKELTLTGTYFVFDTDWKYLNSLKHLKKLSLENCGIDDDGIKNIADGNNLEELHFDFCYLMRDKSLKYIGGIVDLKKITILRNNFITANAFKHLGNLTQLVHLHLQSTCINDENLMYLCEKLHTLKILYLDEKTITDVGFTKINLLRSLTELKIDTCYNITDNSFRYIESLSSLQILSFNYDNLTEIIFSHLLPLTLLKEVNIANIHFSDNALDTFCKQVGMRRKRWQGSWMTTSLTLSKEI